MADHVDPHDETPSAPFRRVLSLIDSLSPRFKPSDETPLREAMPGGWPTIGEFRSFLNSIQPPPPSTHVVGITFPLPSHQEQAAFEEWATESRYEMHQHPLHYLFVDKQTNAARQGWKAALAFVRKLSEGSK